MKVTREEAIAYINTLGDSIDWGADTLEDIRAQVKCGDDYDGMDIWGNMLLSLDREDI